MTGGKAPAGPNGFSFDSFGGYQYDGAMTDRPHTPLLDTVDVPPDIRKLKPQDLRAFPARLPAGRVLAVG
ncbi:MAG: hypothetical protein IBJ13_06645, partial [Sphingopyxis sp.]|nr:hypothetical protein [Sphingopyxis sp.]